MSREYKHIRDCWEAAQETKTIQELVKVLSEFPRWSGDWSIELRGNGKDAVVALINDYTDDYGELQTDEEELDNIQLTDEDIL